MRRLRVKAKRIIIFIGAFGSGKTEVAVNYVLQLKRREPAVGLVDLDIVNPYFRCRDLEAFLRGQGVDLVSTPPGLEQADLPALSPRIFSLLQDPSLPVVFDVGGDPVGARALGRFEPYFSSHAVHLWLVVNPYRPGWDDEGYLHDLTRSLEEMSRLRITGIVDNANLGKETDLRNRLAGARLVEAAAERLSIPMVMRTSSLGLRVERTGEEEILELELFMTPPWEKPSYS